MRFLRIHAQFAKLNSGEKETMNSICALKKYVKGNYKSECIRCADVIIKKTFDIWKFLIESKCNIVLKNNLINSFIKHNKIIERL